MKKMNNWKSLCALLGILALVLGCFVVSRIVVAQDAVASIENNGSRLTAKIENIEEPTYQWWISETRDSGYTPIDGATKEYYDITAADEGKFIKVVVKTVASEPTEDPIGKLVVFDLSQGTVKFDTTYSGKDADGNTVTGTHVGSNIYVITQSDISEYSKNNVEFSGDHNNDIFDVTLAGIHLGKEPIMNHAPNTSTVASYDYGVIDIQKGNVFGTKHVILRLKGENIVRAIHYNNKENGADSSLKITDINGDKATNGGELYIPKKVEKEKIEEFVNSKESYNHWNAGIGGDDGAGDAVNNFEIAGGKLQVLTTYSDNCTAIGAGGNGPCTMTISGGEVVAHCNGTGTAIGGGIGWFSQGGTSNITITGGKVYAKNHGKIYVNGSTITTQDKPYDKVVGGVAIGSGSSFDSNGTTGTVTIKGGYVEAYGTFGNGIGGGNSSKGVGGKATITITGGTVISNAIGGGSSSSSTGGEADIKISGGTTDAGSIGGGNSTSGTGGAAKVKVSGTADVSLEQGIGGGDSVSGTGGAAEITVSGGKLLCAGTIGGGEGGSGNNAQGHGGAAKVTITGGTLTAQSIGGGTGSTLGNGGSATITISETDPSNPSVIETGTIGGGSTKNTTNGKLGFAKATISGGDIKGQFLLAAGGTEPCSFTMTGGMIHDVDTSNEEKYTYVKDEGAAVYMDDPVGIVTISGGTIENCSATVGGAIFMTAGECGISGTAVITGCEADTFGGAVYLGGGNLYIKPGSTGETGGVLSNNHAASGGAAYVNGGNVYVTGGSVTGNTATDSGGGIAVNNGNFKMSGGNVDNNTAQSGRGGGIYVSSAGKPVSVDILSGSVNSNFAETDGGALAVVGQEGSTDDINVQIGVDKQHYDSAGNLLNTTYGCIHDTDNLSSTTCPQLKNNSADVSGGAIYIIGDYDEVAEKYHTSLKVFCVEEEGSHVNVEDSPSDFMMMEGGSVLITTSDYMNANKENLQTTLYGSSHIKSTIHVTGGQMDIWGDMQNPRIEEIITVDIKGANDHFDDHRLYDGYYKLLYYENFLDPETGIISGQYKEIEIKAGSEVEISGSIYSHPGYKIEGWNTSQFDYDEGKVEDNVRDEIFSPIDGKTPIGWYTPGNKHKFDGNPYGDTVIYAIWKANGYQVEFHPNVPIDAAYSGSMEGGQIFYYDQPQSLRPNEYFYVGYEFKGWMTAPNDDVVKYVDEEIVTNLTTQNIVVNLYAKWEKCDHNLTTHEYTYSVIDEGRLQQTLKRTCSCRGYSESVTLSAEDGVYTKPTPNYPIAHPASVSSNATWIDGGISYYKGDDLLTGAPVNAGTYKASITAGGETATVEYIIDKAQQELTKKPVYSVVERVDGSWIEIQAVPGSNYKDNVDMNLVTQYQVVLNTEEVKEEDWMNEKEPSSPFAAEYKPEFDYTSYKIYARYAGNENYYPSEPLRATQVLFFANGVVTVDAEYGIDFDVKIIDEEDKKGLYIDVRAIDGYYLTSDFGADITSVDEDTKFPTSTQAKLISLTAFEKYQLGDVPKNAITEVILRGVSAIPAITGKITESEYFDQVNDNSASITRDSAYTASYIIENFDSSVYKQPVLKFNQSLPNGTTIIMQHIKDFETNPKAEYYWCIVKDDNFKEIAVDKFTRMGRSSYDEENAFQVPSEKTLLQFIVDFSDVANGMTGIELESTLSLSEPKDNRAPSVNCYMNTLLDNIPSFSLNANGEGLEKSIVCTYQSGNSVASKYNNKDTALVITSKTTLPKDTYLLCVSDDGMTRRHYTNSNGQFIVPLSTVRSSTTSLTLVSKLWPVVDTTYQMEVGWMLVDSIAGNAPMGGTPLDKCDVEFAYFYQPEPAVKIVSDRTTLAKDDSRIQFMVKMDNIPSHYDVEVELLFKGKAGYVGTGWRQEVSLEMNNDGSVRYPVIDLDVASIQLGKGAYCAEVTVINGLIQVLSDQVYFVME